MSDNSTETAVTNSGSSTVGIAVVLTLFFLLLIVVAGVMLYKYQSKIRNILQSRQRRSQKKDTTEVDPHHYTTMITDQPAVQAPIYENITTGTSGYSRPTHHSRAPEPEEDLYLECDIQDDAIYSNDPECNLAISQEEDVYIMPDT